MTMKLIPRRTKAEPAERGLGIVRLALKGLVAQRVARKVHRRYKLIRRLPFLLTGGAVLTFIAKKALGRGRQADAGFTQPAPVPAPTEAPAASPAAGSTPEPAGAPTPVAAVDGAPSPAAQAASGTAAIVETEATTPAHPAAAGTGGAEGDGVPSDEESAADSGESTDAPPPKD